MATPAKPTTSRKRARRAVWTDEELEKAILRHRGILTQVAKSLGVTRHAIADYIDKDHQRWKPILNSCRETIIDGAECTLLAAIEEGDVGAAQYTLRTLGRARGWADRMEHSGPDGGPIAIEITGARSALAARLAAVTPSE